VADDGSDDEGAAVDAPALGEESLPRPVDVGSARATDPRARRIGCADLALCARHCDPGDVACAHGCATAAHAGAVSTFVPLLACAGRFGCADEDAACAMEHCSKQLAACLEHRPGARGL
jgi:hypothetical protein